MFFVRVENPERNIIPKKARERGRGGPFSFVVAYTGRPRVILSLLPEAPPRLFFGYFVSR